MSGAGRSGRSVSEGEEGTGLSLFTRRAWTVAGIAVAVLLGLGLLTHAAGFLLLLFAGILLAVFLHGLSSTLAERTPLPYGPALALVGISLVAVLGIAGWIFGPPLVEQLADLWERLPHSLGELRSSVEDTGWGAPLADALPSDEPFPPPRWDVLGSVTGMASSALGMLTNVAVVVFLGIYLAADPGRYRAGILALVPSARRDRAAEVLDALGRALRRWLLGRFSSMAVVGSLTTVGLWILGVPVALALGLLAGLLSFVPYVGPVAAVVPALLVGWGQSPETALWVGALYGAVQFLESWLITPLIQRGTVHLLPALLIASQVLLGVLVGALGVLLATPLMVSAVVLVQMLWVEDVVGEEVERLGE